MGASSARPGRDLPAAVGVAFVLLAILVATLLFWHWGFILLAMAMLSVAAFELNTVLRQAGFRPAILPVVSGILVMLPATYAAAIGGFARLPWTLVLLGCLAATVVLALVIRMFGGASGFIKDASASLFLIGYVMLMGAFIPLILVGDGGAARIATYLLCVVASDTGGYAIGVWLGRHKMAPRISPNKTWEGLVGSVLFALVVGVFMAVNFLGASWWVGAILAVVIVVFGTCGDLIESMVKRDLGIKDMSSVLPGHGGVMDRIDAMLIAAPAAWLVFVLLVPST